MVDNNKTYVGIVEDNQDPKKIGRVRIRVMDVFDDFDLEDIPWAMPWKDLNGNGFNIPENGKVVMVVFDQGGQDNPEYIYADHYNINLENKLKSLSNDDYSSMKSLLFDHKTQIYVNDSEGLKIDHKYNNINLTENGVDINLKDNNTNVNIGDSTADQQAILGNHFMDWIEEFLDALKSGGLYNSSGPVMPKPALIKSIIKFKSLRDLKFLSHHVNIVDNNKVKSVSSENREDLAQYGDNWASTKEENVITENKLEEFRPEKGPKKEFDLLKNDSELEMPSVSNEDIGNLLEIEEVENVTEVFNEYEATNPKVERLVNFIKSKNYIVYDEIGVLNIVAMRDKKNGVITNKFDDVLNVFYKDESGEWILEEFNITTVPGLKISGDSLPINSKIMACGQYIDQCEIQNNGSVRYLSFHESIVHINDNVDKYNFLSETESISYLRIYVSNANGSSEYVYNYSTGDQVFKNINQYNRFLKLCDIQNDKKSTFTYTLCRKEDFDS